MCKGINTRNMTFKFGEEFSHELPKGMGTMWNVCTRYSCSIMEIIWGHQRNRYRRISVYFCTFSLDAETITTRNTFYTIMSHISSTNRPVISIYICIQGRSRCDDVQVIIIVSNHKILV